MNHPSGLIIFQRDIWKPLEKGWTKVTPGDQSHPGLRYWKYLQKSCYLFNQTIPRKCKNKMLCEKQQFSINLLYALMTNWRR